MQQTVQSTPPPPSPLPRYLQWILLILLSVMLAGLLTVLDFPASWLIGPMIAGIVVSGLGGTLRISTGWALVGQGILGCVIADAMPLEVSSSLLADWPLFMGVVLILLAITAAIGWALMVAKILPGTTVVWGISPGAATMMTFMAENAGADGQLVAFMQFSRIVLIAAIASLVAKFFGLDSSGSTDGPDWLAPVDWLSMLETLALGLSGPILARITGIKAAALLVPLAAGIFLVHFGWLDIHLPIWLLVIVYTLLGWRIGLRFTRLLIRHALKALPAVLISSMALIGGCAGIAVLLVVFADVDPLTAYLATSPGGADTIAVLATSSSADTAFVMTMQILRFLIVLAVGPLVAKLVARHLAKKAGSV
ncbi:MAG: hypothetical protein VR78_13365 [Hoeflea sp. BRH_c9]|nr:MAG: hypothetical protein VR78_13365 [Hoeflea sp. BRH_c9]